MIQDESEQVMAAYRDAMSSSWDDAAGVLAAEAEYSRLHPEISDSALISERAGRIVGLAVIGDPASFWGGVVGEA